MEEITELRGIWRQKRIQRMVDRLQSKQKDQRKPLSHKVLGFKPIMLKTNDNLPGSNLGALESKSIPPKHSKTIRILPRCSSAPKIVPRETKLSLQRKSMLDPHYNLKKLFESKSAISTAGHLKSSWQVCRKSKKGKLLTPEIISHSCINLLDVPPKTDKGLPGFSPLVKGLDSWLMKRGKRFCSFRNLSKAVAKQEPALFLLQECDEKENTELSFGNSTESFPSETIEDQNGAQALQEEAETENMKRVLEGGLEDLSAIIRMGYPLKDCEVWLTAMLSHYPDLTKYPLCWECKAAINSRMGLRQERPPTDINNRINTQVCDLVNKLKVLNLNTPKNETTTEEISHKRRVLIDMNVNNVVNSSSIQFSVKKKEKIEDGSNFVVTPVRRSARNNKCRIHNTNENDKCVKSLLDLSQEVRERMEFEPNMALLNR